jgi:YfiR/HmsC-like
VALVMGRSAMGDEAQAALENTIKASYLYNFAVHTEWPDGAFAGPDAPMVIGLAGDVPFAPALEVGLRGKNLGGRKIIVRAVGSNDEAGRCHVLFIGAVTPKRMAMLLAAVAAKPVLTVSESEGFAKRGGILNLFRGESSLKFEANPSAAARMHVKLSSQLLKLARIVKDDAPLVKD